MLDSLVSALIKQLFSIVREQVEKKVELVTGVDREVKNLEKNLGAIRTVLMDAEKRQLREDDVRFWLEELKDVSHDMDSVLDEWNTAILKSILLLEEGAESGTTNTSTTADDQITKWKVCFSFLFPCFQFSELSPQVITHRLDIANKIKSLNENLEEINTRKDRFNFTIIGDRVEPRRPESTTSILDVAVVYGQDKNKKLLIDRLVLSGSNPTTNKELRIIPILGMGGIGKTTLARNAYNDDQVKAHFEGRQRIWVCVSDQFSFLKIAKEITEQLIGDGGSLTNLGPEALTQKFLDSIKDKKFLLVLDDVWTIPNKEWDPLLQALTRLGAVGSRVVVTTRKQDVVRMVGSTHVIRMEKLSDKDCWSLLCEIAFFERTNEEREDFEELSWAIALKCDGLPLAAKTLGSLMRLNDIEDWPKILQSDIWNFDNVKEDLFQPLLLSYYDLPHTEKNCFSYCAIFPKDYEMDREDLIQQWTAQGYFRMHDNEEAEVIGQKCFKNIAMRSFFQEFSYNDDGSVKTCKMHDIVHDFAQFLTLNEFSTVSLILNAQQNVNLKARHLNLLLIISETINIPTFSISNSKSLHSLMLQNDFSIDYYSRRIVPIRFLDLKHLRVLSLSGYFMELPTNIGDLIHLRYLNLFDIGREFKLPPTVGDLLNLQTLRLLQCRVTELPEEVGNLINLRHLYANYGGLSWPKGIGRCISLRTLERIPIRSESQYFQLRHFGNLNHLRSIYLKDLGTEEHVEEAKEAQLHNKTHLEDLSLFFLEGDSRAETHTNVLEALKPHPNLKSLLISYYCGPSISPSWMLSLVNLKKLHLRRSHNYETLPPLGKLRSLEQLFIGRSRGLKRLGHEFLGVEIVNGRPEIASDKLFPKLKEIFFERAVSLREWDGVPGWSVNCPLKIMPRLQSLTLRDCPSLESLPDFLESTPLKYLSISGSQAMCESCEEETGRDWPKIRHVPNIYVTM